MTESRRKSNPQPRPHLETVDYLGHQVTPEFAAELREIHAAGGSHWSDTPRQVKFRPSDSDHRWGQLHLPTITNYSPADDAELRRLSGVGRVGGWSGPRHYGHGCTLDGSPEAILRAVALLERQGHVSPEAAAAARAMIAESGTTAANTPEIVPMSEVSDWMHARLSRAGAAVRHSPTMPTNPMPDRQIGLLAILFGGDCGACCDEAAVIREDGDIVALASIAPEGEMAEGDPSIVGLYVVPERRRQGLGAAVLTAAIARCALRGLSLPVRVDLCSSAIVCLLDALPPETRRQVRAMDCGRYLDWIDVEPTSEPNPVSAERIAL